MVDRALVAARTPIHRAGCINRTGCTTCGGWCHACAAPEFDGGAASCRDHRELGRVAETARRSEQAAVSSGSMVTLRWSRYVASGIGIMQRGGSRIRRNRVSDARSCNGGAEADKSMNWRRPSGPDVGRAETFCGETEGVAAET